MLYSYCKRLPIAIYICILIHLHGSDFGLFQRSGMHRQSTNNVLKILDSFEFPHDNYGALPQDSGSFPELVLARLLPFQCRGRLFFMRLPTDTGFASTKPSLCHQKEEENRRRVRYEVVASHSRYGGRRPWAALVRPSAHCNRQ